MAATILPIFFNLLYLSGGIAPAPKYKFLEIPYSIFISCVFIVQILGCIVGYLNTPELSSRMEILLQISSHVYLTSLHWVLKLNRRRLQTFIAHFQHSDHWSPSSSDRISRLTVTFFQNSLKVDLTAFCLFLVLISFVSLAAPLFMDFTFDDKYIYVLPFWFNCDISGQNKFPVPFLCWNIDSFSKYAMINGIAVALLNVELFSYLTTFAFFCFTQAHFKAHLQAILERIGKLEAAQSDMIHGGPQRTDDDFTLELVKIIKHHQYLRQ